VEKINKFQFRYNDVSFVKSHKIKLLVKISNESNSIPIIDELRYFKDQNFFFCLKISIS